MSPELFYIGKYAVSSYYSLITLGIFVGLFIFHLGIKKAKLNTVITIDIGLIISFSAYFGARLFHVIFEMPEFYLKNPAEIFAFWKGGYVYYGGVLFPLIFIYIYCRKKNIKMITLTDLMAPGVALGTAVGRIGCLLQGCCYGHATTMPWGITFPFDTPDPTPKGISLHPTQLYMSVGNLLIFVFLYFLGKKTQKQGVQTYSYLIIYGIGRSVIEFFREDFRGDLFSPYLSTSQLISLIVVIYALWNLFLKEKIWIKIKHSKK